MNTDPAPSVLSTTRSPCIACARLRLIASPNPMPASGPAEPFTAPAARLGMTTHAFTVALHRLRQRVGHRLRADVAETVTSENEVDEELRHLIAAVSAP